MGYLEHVDAAVAVAARGYLYQLFQSIFAAEPKTGAYRAYDASLAAASFEALDVPLEECAQARELCEGLSALSAPRFDEAALQRRYMELFVGPGTPKGSPWESLFLAHEPRMFGEVTLAVRKTYKSFGVTPAMGSAVADDHIALELAFMLELNGRLARAAESDGLASAAARSALDGSAGFLREHLLRWVDRFAQSVCDSETKAGHAGGFYVAAARGLVVFLHNDLDVVEGLRARG